MADLGSFSVEWIDRNAGPCVFCNQDTGTGPVGWHKADPAGPVCDHCMIEAARGLGALMMTANVLRELAEEPIDDARSFQRVVIALRAYAGRYNRSESAWPIRRFHLLEMLDELGEEYLPPAEGS